MFEHILSKFVYTHVTGPCIVVFSGMVGVSVIFLFLFLPSKVQPTSHLPSLVSRLGHKPWFLTYDVPTLLTHLPYLP